MRTFLVVFLFTLSLGCKEAFLKAELDGLTTYPLSSYSAPTDQDDVFRRSTVDSYGDGVALASWGLNPADGQVLGKWSFSSGVFSYSRSSLTSCASGAAPNCAGGVDSGSYGHVDWNLYPSAGDLYLRWSAIKRISVDIKQTRSTSDTTLHNDCGLAFGFGSKQAHSNASALPVDLSIPGRGAPSVKDQFRILYRLHGDGDDALVADAPINNATENTDLGWGLFDRDTLFDVTTAGTLAENSDWIQYNLSMAFDHAEHTITFTVTPLDSSEPMFNYVSQTYIWNYSNSPTATSGGEFDGGLRFGPENPNMPLTLSTFESSNVAIGFSANGRVLGCEFSDMKLSRK